MNVGSRTRRVAPANVGQAKTVGSDRAECAQTIVQSLIFDIICRPDLRKLGDARTVGPLVP